jgi:hypothetical protein
VRRYIIFSALCLIFFFLPLQVFIIGDYTGIGIQGAMYRYQMSGYGTFFFPITREIAFVLNGTLSGRTALSVILWFSGSILLACTTIFSFFHIDDAIADYHRQVFSGLIVSCLIWLGSCIAQYGFLFHGPAGISLPAGIIAILCWIAILYYYLKCTPSITDTT